MLRSLARGVAKKRMKKMGMVRLCKGSQSFFSKHWREYVY